MCLSTAWISDQARLEMPVTVMPEVGCTELFSAFVVVSLF